MATDKAATRFAAAGSPALNTARSLWAVHRWAKQFFVLAARAVGPAYTAKGITTPWPRGKAIDLELRSAEFDYYSE